MIDFLLHFDTLLTSIIQQYGVWAYVFVFVVIFCETGLVITPFLPGDSLLFIMGTLTAAKLLDLPLALAIVAVAGILGDTVNYHVGRTIGPKIFHSDTNRFLNKKHLVQTQKFYDTYGPKTIIFARFIPIIRTFAPFVAGIGKMEYKKFLTWNVIGGLIWTFFFILTGYFFGNIPFIKKNITLVVLGIIILSVIPPAIEYLRSRRENS